MHTVPLLLSFVALTLTACSGLDPRLLERLRPGMDRATVATELEREGEAIPVMRFFAVGDDGREQEIVIDVYEGAERCADYALVSIDGELAVVTTASTRAPRWGDDGQWWRDREHWDRDALVRTWSPPQLQTLAVGAVRQRALPLEWPRLEPIDAAHRAPSRHTGSAMAFVLVFPLVIYGPYWLLVQALGDPEARSAREARAFLLAASRTTTPEQVIAELGATECKGDWDDGAVKQRVLRWTRGRFTIHAGFRDDRLLWADFGRWEDWAPAFIR
jgi:hypothetical protein